ncbi:isocitrate/isopropylmalate dehydrogenase family protein [Anaerosalibacter bizertensis]|uniref:Isocitrate/isopropylmalate dehydrogenase family protein n=1 Tax=Anaerosalibacter bizertensis TaxID=932217 RepID=A0A844FGN9_9FIRM|nr:isocitrate/isopropylmalate dehydrogenase family protein [Anaerosalibacter bizertensis]MBV1819101.1 isocitrate/isopropylmalate dehydrogenase family protein [Bacteroidales bacterium MSK.15.36]MBU5293818.1 isocitrate/isopropylmalate dehydrogenase family protein [Anaerosalibacter bizertensis]MCG4565388.1 isocitrate/isopropylmalate dehydrogenase family protein [Anaerosalibacter bizertensis]MCG4582953.1 isocitrate/isopropylmalate dehydrogenase family protein [Anaerosalibacter bizertensis]MSS43197
MAYNITLIPGDGIGPEVIGAARKVIDASGVDISWEIVEAGAISNKNLGTPLPNYVINSIKKNKIALKGPVTTPIGEGFKSVNVTLRQNLNLFANIRPIKSYEGIESIHKNVDFVVVRENTEDLYTGIEHMVGEDAAESIKIITKDASERICRFAFELARREGRKKVTLVHKANIMKLSDGLFLRCGKEIAKEYTDIEFEDIIVDAMSMKLVQNPQNYDVIVAPNLYGDILSDLSAGLVGGLGLAPGANIGEDIAVFESVHGSAPDIAGKNIANPTSAILSGVMMLKYIGEERVAKKIENALAETLKDKGTIDLGGNLGTEEFAQEVIKNLK